MVLIRSGCVYTPVTGVFLLSEHGLPAPSAVVVDSACMHPLIHFLEYLWKFPLHAFIPSQAGIPSGSLPRLIQANLSRPPFRLAPLPAAPSSLRQISPAASA